MTHPWRALGYLAAAVLAGYFAWFLAGSIDMAMLESAMSPKLVAALALSAVMYASIIPITGWAWRRLLSGQGERWRISWLTALLAATQLAKYVPGNIAQHASRAALAMRGGMAGRSLVSTVAQETILAAAASVVVGVLMYAISAPGAGRLPDDARAGLLWVGPLLGLACVALASVRISPQHASASPHRLIRLLGRMGGLPGARVALPAFAAYALNYLLIGIGLWVVARASGMPSALDLPLVTAAFALSWLVGFLAPGAPAGLGVREGIMVVLLSGAADNAQLLVFVLLARLVTMLGDACNFLIGSAWLAVDQSKGNAIS